MLFTPIEGVVFNFSNPNLAKILFSPVMGTISQAILMQTKSRNWKSNSSFIKFFWAYAWQSLKPIPHPDNSLYGYLQSACLGFNIASAAGNVSQPSLFLSGM